MNFLKFLGIERALKKDDAALFACSSPSPFAAFVGSARNACAYLGQGGKASSQGTPLYMYIPSQGLILFFKLFARRIIFSILVT